MSRADHISPLENVPTYYSDFPIDFSKHPVTGQLAVITNEESVKQSIKNLVLTNLGERFYDPLKGSRVKESLFEPMGAMTTESIRSTIQHAVETYERRANVVGVEIEEEENGYHAHIFFSLINIAQTHSVSVFLQRVR